MAENQKFQEIVQRYGLEPVPATVARLADLVSKQEATAEEIARVIGQDPVLSARLLRAANPRAQDESDYGITGVEDALMRTGTGYALILVMGVLLTEALVKTFQTMLSLRVSQIDRKSAAALEGEQVLGTLGFSGRATGRAYLRLSADAAKSIAAGMLGLSPDELGSPVEINDAVGEVANIVVGNFKSNLCDAGLNCSLSAPQITRTMEWRAEVVSGGNVERLAFRVAESTLFLDLTVNPWNE